MELKTIQTLEKACGCNLCASIESCLCPTCEEVNDYDFCVIDCKYNPDVII